MARLHRRHYQNNTHQVNGEEARTEVEGYRFHLYSDSRKDPSMRTTVAMRCASQYKGDYTGVVAARVIVSARDSSCLLNQQTSA